MTLSINTNVASLNAQRNLGVSQNSLQQSIQRLSSGLRVNSAKDDAAGLAIAERLNANIKGQNVAIRNASDAISLSQTAEGAIGNIGDALQRLRELAVQSANGTNSSGDRSNLQTEFAQLSSEVSRLVNGTTFNGTALLNASQSFTFQVGAGTTTNDTITVAGANLASTATNVAALDISGTTSAGATAAITALDAEITTVTTSRANLGAVQNRFESVISSLQVSSENLSASRGRIIDADFAAETANLTKSQILQQAGTAVLAKANQSQQSVLQLLQG